MRRIVVAIALLAALASGIPADAALEAFCTARAPVTALSGHQSIFGPSCNLPLYCESLSCAWRIEVHADGIGLVSVSARPPDAPPAAAYCQAPMQCNGQGVYVSPPLGAGVYTLKCEPWRPLDAVAVSLTISCYAYRP